MAENLATLAEVKAWLGIPTATTDSDALLNSLIPAASRFVLGQLNRPSLLMRSYSETRDGLGMGSMMMRNWPIISVSALAINGSAIAASIPWIANASPQSGYMIGDVWDGIPPGRPQLLYLRGYGFTIGQQNIIASYLAGYGVVDEAATVPPTAGPYEITIVPNYGSWVADSGVKIASSGVALTKVTGAPGAGQYQLDASATPTPGKYIFNAAQQAVPVLISYSYVPADIRQGVIEIIGAQFRYKDRIGYLSKSLGGQETVTFSMDSMQPITKEALNDYRMVVPI